MLSFLLLLLNCDLWNYARHVSAELVRNKTYMYLFLRNQNQVCMLRGGVLDLLILSQRG